jgi:dipeptidyl aminopeptidase/acylaminoacyl peptidase
MLLRRWITDFFKTTSYDGTQIEAALFTPQAAKGGRMSPLVLLVHGGPAVNHRGTVALAVQQADALQQARIRISGSCH